MTDLLNLPGRDSLDIEQRKIAGPWLDMLREGLKHIESVTMIYFPLQTTLEGSKKPQTQLCVPSQTLYLLYIVSYPITYTTLAIPKNPISEVKKKITSTKIQSLAPHFSPEWFGLKEIEPTFESLS